MGRIILVFFAVLSIIFICWMGLRACATANETAAVINQELGPQALNTKYEWFKNAHAQLTARDQTIKMLSNKINRMRDQYLGVKRTDWARLDIESINQWESERDGTIAAYNNLAAEYNAEMSKFHTAFLNSGIMVGSTLPQNIAIYKGDSN